MQTTPEAFSSSILPAPLRQRVSVILRPLRRGRAVPSSTAAKESLRTRTVQASGAMIRWHYSATSGAYMFEAYNAQAKTVADLLSETHQGRVVVPAFQRGYSWGKKHVDRSKMPLTISAERHKKRVAQISIFLAR